MEEHWLETDEAADVAGSLRHAIICFELARSDPHAWKWAFLALYSALQGACVCHLTTTAPPIGALTKANTAEWLDYLEASRSDGKLAPPKTHIMSFPDLLKAVRKPNSAGDHSNHPIIQITDTQLTWLKRLHEDIRNQFVHFEARGWMIEVTGLREFANHTARIIQSILSAGWAFRHLDDEQHSDLRLSFGSSSVCLGN